MFKTTSYTFSLFKSSSLIQKGSQYRSLVYWICKISAFTSTYAEWRQKTSSGSVLRTRLSSTLAYVPVPTTPAVQKSHFDGNFRSDSLDAATSNTQTQMRWRQCSISEVSNVEENLRCTSNSITMLEPFIICLLFWIPHLWKYSSLLFIDPMLSFSLIVIYIS